MQRAVCLYLGKRWLPYIVLAYGPMGAPSPRVVSSCSCALWRYARKILYIRKRKTRAHIGIAIGVDGLCRRVLMMRPPHGLGLAVEHREYDYYRAAIL